MAKTKPPQPKTRREELRETTKSKRIYFVVDEEKGIDQKCREVFINVEKIVHYPSGFDGGSRYNNVKKFVFTGFRNNSSLPVGIQKTNTYGYGFTKEFKPFMDELEDKLKLKEIHVNKTGTDSLTKTKLTLTEATLKKLRPIFKNLIDRQKQERRDLATEKLNQSFPTKIKAPKKKYIPNSLNAILDTWSQALDEFSARDKSAIKDLFDKLSITDEFWTPEALLKTKESLDQQYIEDVVSEFKKLMKQKNETQTLEKRWQKFLGTNNWVFSYIFSFPIMLFQDEAYVGGKNLSNKNGKITDFLVKNELTENVAFLEIKTHKTELLGAKKSYRGNDVYSISKDLTGGINQVLDQRDNFQKEYYIHDGKSSESFQTLNSKCVVLMGTVKSMSKNQLKSFELFRSNSKDVEIITFDEFLARIENLQKLMDTEN